MSIDRRKINLGWTLLPADKSPAGATTAQLDAFDQWLVVRR
jgi:hypothetical protein